MKWSLVGLLTLLSGSVVYLPAPDALETVPVGDPSFARPAMQAFARGLKALQAGADAGDLAGCVDHAVALERATALLADATPADASRFRKHAGTLAALTAGLTEQARLGDLLRLRGGITELRRTCVACHEALRPQPDARRMYPARGSIVRGKVTLKDSSGDPRSDARGVVVFLDGVPYAGAPPLVQPVVSQRNRQFSPRVLAVVRGSEVAFPNDDTIYHNVFSLSKSCCFDLDVYESGKTKTVKFKKTGLVKVFCNIHPEMSCSILVLGNPWFAVTEKDGSFSIPEVPEGSYVLRAWSTLGGTYRKELRVAAPTQEVSLELTETMQRVPRHRNKFGRRYRRKYK